MAAGAAQLASKRTFAEVDEDSEKPRDAGVHELAFRLSVLITAKDCVSRGLCDGNLLSVHWSWILSHTLAQGTALLP